MSGFSSRLVREGSELDGLAAAAAAQLRLTVAPAAPVLLGELELDRSVPGLQEQPEQYWARLQVQGRELETLLARLLWGQLRACGLLKASAAESVAVDTLLLSPGYGRWLEHSLQLLQEHGYLKREGELLVAAQPAPELAELWTEWESYKAEASREQHWQQAYLALLDACLRALPEIVHGRKAATEVLFPNSSMDRVSGIYRDHPVADHFNEVLAQSLLAYVRARLEAEPSTRLRLVEIGAGTGGTSARLFEALAPYAGQIEEYCYSDISKAFLLHAEQRYSERAPYLRTQLFNVEAAPEAQGLTPGSYDLVIATNVLHATADMRATLRNAKALLRGGGVLLLNEMSASGVGAHLSFGLLAGWWLAQDRALRLSGSPALAPATWRELLLAEGFGPVVQPRPGDHRLGQQIILAQSDGWVRGQTAIPPESAEVSQHAHVTDQISSADMPSSRRSLQCDDAIQALPSRLRRGEVTEQMLKGHVRQTVVEAIAGSLKMNEALIDEDRSFSDYGVDSILAVGLINTINDQCGLMLPTTALFDYNTLDQLIRHLLAEHSPSLMASLQADLPVEATVEAGRPRSLLPARPARAEARRTRRRRFVPPISSSVEDALPERPEGTADRHGRTYHRVLLERPGDIESIRLVRSSVPELAADQVQIAVRAYALNFADLLCVRGLYPNMPSYPFTPGFEVSGVVVATGAAVDNVRVGDEVIALADEALGGQATLLSCDMRFVFAKPLALSFEQACALPAVSLTMIDVFRKAQVKPGERVLIQTAAGGTGLVAVQLALHHGAEIYATAGSREKLDYLARLGVSYLINYLEVDFEEEIARLTGGRGIDVVINTLSGEAIQKGMRCLAPGGRYVELAMTALKSARSIDLSMLNSNQSFYSVDMRRQGSVNPVLVKGYFDELMALVAQGIITPTISRVFPFDQFKEAHRWLDNRQNIGKVVVGIPEAFQLQVLDLADVSSPRRGPVHAVAHHPEPIAIIGMSGRFGPSETVDQLWEHLAGGESLIQEVSRWEISRLHPGQDADKYCRHGSFLTDIDCFDPLFFKISGAEATYMDPQQRLFLQEAWRALEDAGYAGAGIQGRRCGVYVGCASGDYFSLFDKTDDSIPAQAFWGNACSIVPARIAYYLDLQGPAVAVDTACSSSLVAMHLACQGLWSGETELALAGGVLVQCSPDFFRSSNHAGMLSPSGRCHTFDEQADGFVPGEGVGIVVLKRLSKALADGDHIHGVIRGSGINQDGATNGITAPSALAQQRLVRGVLRRLRHPSRQNPDGRGPRYRNQAW